jgi:hypothetical protein
MAQQNRYKKWVNCRGASEKKMNFPKRTHLSIVETKILSLFSSWPFFRCHLSSNSIRRRGNSPLYKIDFSHTRGDKGGAHETNICQVWDVLRGWTLNDLVVGDGDENELLMWILPVASLESGALLALYSPQDAPLQFKYAKSIKTERNSTS